MSGRNVFGGGEIDVGTLLAHLSGRPLQAEFEEAFSPASGEPLRRHGRLLVSSSGCVRTDVTEGDAPTVAFVFDSRRGLCSGGLAESPETWFSHPWSGPIERLPVAFTGPTPALPDTTPVEGFPCHVWHAEADGGRTTFWYSLELGIPMRIESSDANGTKTYRVHSVRFEEPEASWFP